LEPARLLYATYADAATLPVKLKGSRHAEEAAFIARMSRLKADIVSLH